MNIICIGNIGWNYLWQRPQHIMSRLAINNKVLYVEETQSIISLVRRLQFSVIRKENDVLVLTPIGVPFGLQKINIFKHINFYILCITLKIIMRKYGFNDSVLWFYNIRMADLIDKVNKQIVVYDCVDEFNAFTGSTESDKADELKLLKSADIVFTSSEQLYVNKGKYTKKIYLIKNAADIEHFSKTDETFKSEELSQIKKPIIGYVGAIWDWFDFDLIAFLAKAHPEISIVLIGPVNADTSSISRFHNVFFFGKKPYKDLPNYIGYFDVCIIPFKVNELTENADPIKLYEYMATGKPIVSTNLSEAKKFSCVKIGENYNNFIKHTIDSISNHEIENEVNKDLLAENHSWAKRVRDIEEIIHKNIRE